MKTEISLLTTAAGLIVVVLFLFLRRSNTAEERAHPDLGVKELVERLTTELENLDRERHQNGKASVLQLRDVEVEISFAVKRTKSSTAEVKFEVVTLGDDTELAKEQIQRLKLSLTPSAPRTGATPPLDE